MQKPADQVYAVQASDSEASFSSLSWSSSCSAVFGRTPTLLPDSYGIAIKKKIYENLNQEATGRWREVSSRQEGGETAKKRNGRMFFERSGALAAALKLNVVHTKVVAASGTQAATVLNGNGKAVLSDYLPLGTETSSMLSAF